MAAAAGITALSSYAEDALPLGITRLGLMTVGQSDYYVPIPPSYPLESSETKIGPDRKWMKAVWYPTGQNASNWSEMMSFLILPGNVPPIDVMSAQLKKSCPNSFSNLPAPIPHFVLEHESANAVQLGCGPDGTSPVSLRGYYVAVRTKEYSYLLSREHRANAFKVNESLPAGTLEEWRKVFGKFAVCQKGDLCFKLKTQNK